jgi:hypothetical protein
VDEASFHEGPRVAPTRWITGLVDLERGRLLEVVADRTRAAVAGWLQARPRSWLARVAMVALDPWRGYASALVTPLGHARVVVDHVHAIRLANTVVDQLRRRTQQATLGHRGRTYDPLCVDAWGLRGELLCQALDPQGPACPSSRPSRSPAGVPMRVVCPAGALGFRRLPAK